MCGPKFCSMRISRELHGYDEPEGEGEDVVRKG
jgi:hypothetical protein